MTKRLIEDYLKDILDAVRAIEQFTAGLDLMGFSQNLEKVFAVSRADDIQTSSGVISLECAIN